MKRWMKPSKKAIVTTIGTGESRPMNRRTHQVPLDRLRIASAWNRVGGDGEAPHRSRMTVADFLAKVVHDLRARRVGSRGDVGASHPVDEVALEHGRVARDDAAALRGGQLFGIVKSREQVLDLPLDSRLNRCGGTITRRRQLLKSSQLLVAPAAFLPGPIRESDRTLMTNVEFWRQQRNHPDVTSGTRTSG
jgi:hypothetical protein